MTYFTSDLPGINTARFIMGRNGDFQIMMREPEFNRYCFDLVYNPAGHRDIVIIPEIPYQMVLDSYFFNENDIDLDIDLRSLWKELK